MMYSLQLWKGLSSKTKIVHSVSWIIGLILINIPAFEATLGLFDAEDRSLLFPSIYGTLINMAIFYGNAQLVKLFLRKRPRWFWKRSAQLFLATTFFEVVPDILFYYFFYANLTPFIAWEIFMGVVLMNGIFFYIPSFILGFALEWQQSDITQNDRILIKSGSHSFKTPSNEIYYIESDGNYCTYITSTKSIVVRKSLSLIEDELPSNFVRCHKSYIVNTALIDRQTYNEVCIGSFQIPIGRKYRNAIKSVLTG